MRVVRSLTNGGIHLATAAETYAPARTGPAHPARSNGRSLSGSTRRQSLAQGLAGFSVGLGLAQVVAPRRVADLIGVEDSDRNATCARSSICRIAGLKD
jgi:hypothetical protein